jgi:hypothetical protein
MTLEKSYFYKKVLFWYQTGLYKILHDLAKITLFRIYIWLQQLYLVATILFD